MESDYSDLAEVLYLQFITRPRMGPSLGFVTCFLFCRRVVETIIN